MMTTQNSGSISEDDFNHKDNPDNDNGKTQTQIDQEQDLVKAEVSAPISESQVQPGREVQDKQNAKLNQNTKPGQNV